MLLILVWRQSLFATMPLRRMPLTPLLLPNPVDRTRASRGQYTQVCEKINGNGRILTEQRLGEVGCSDDEIFATPLPSPSSINIEPFSTFNAYNCRRVKEPWWLHCSDDFHSLPSLSEREERQITITSTVTSMGDCAGWERGGCVTWAPITKKKCAHAHN